MSTLRKLRVNLATFEVFRVLGVAQALRYWFLFLRFLPSIVRTRKLRPLEERMGRGLDTLTFRGRTIHLDCERTDAMTTSGELRGSPYMFSYVRELFIRDCYFRHLPARVYENSRTIMDLGSNCGAFSCLVSPVAGNILAVDANPAFREVFARNMHLNHFHDYRWRNGFVGHAGSFAETFPEARRFSMFELMDEAGLAWVDLVKMDIEGSEFSLFEEPAWLARVGAITMEVHQGFPGRQQALDALDRHGFELVLADENLVRVEDPSGAMFLYAWKPDSTDGRANGS